MLKILSRVFNPNQRELSRLAKIVEKINGLEPEIKALSDEQLRQKTAEFKSRLTPNLLTPLLPEAFATAREGIRRVIGERAYDVQLMAAIALHEGKIAEQKTGEGKTLSAAITLYLNALLGRGTHLVTVNDFLARRDTGWYGVALDFLGLKVATLVHEQSFIFDSTFTDPTYSDERLKHLRPITRKEAYLADVTYGTNNEFGFDYLRDNMVWELPQMVQRGHYFAIVDEVDSILIDEARTPLIISAPAEESNELYLRFADLVPNLSATDYLVHEKEKAVHLTDLGVKKVEKWLKIGNLYENFTLAHHLDQALKAQFLYWRDRDYVVKDNEVIIVDEFTGRLMPGRRFAEGLHQAIEAKEKVPIQKESKTVATITFQNYFRLYERLAGMTGTAATEAEEFHKIYKLEVVTIPTNMPMIRQNFPDRVYKHQRAKWKAIVDEIGEAHKRGQPVLSGTTSVEKNELLSDYLKRRGITHEVLNAKNHEREAEIIAKAGERGAVTIATNMAGRGTDIRLGPGVVELGGLHVVGTERHEARRIDNQLRGRSGRQGDCGSSRFYVALDDDLMRVFGGERIQGLMTRFNLPEDVPIEAGMVSKAIENAQIKVEGFNFDIRKHLVEYDDVINKQREIIYQKRRGLLEEIPPNAQVESLSSNLKQSMVEKIRRYTENPEEALRIYQEKEKQFGPQLMRRVERLVQLQTLDQLWMDHIDALDELRLGIGLRGWGQKDPLVEFKNEAFLLFEKLLREIEATTVARLLQIEVEVKQPVQPERQRLEERRGEMLATVPAAVSPMVKTPEQKLGRNDPCFCGAKHPDGRPVKYKHCHGR